MEIGRRHTVLERRLSRNLPILPPITDSRNFSDNNMRERSRSIAAVRLPLNESAYGTIINGQLPVKLPNINAERKMSLQVNLDFSIIEQSSRGNCSRKKKTKISDKRAPNFQLLIV